VEARFAWRPPRRSLAWLRHKRKTREVIAYLRAEKRIYEAILKPTEPFQEKHLSGDARRILQTDLSVPYKLLGYLYFTRTEEGKHTHSIPAATTRKAR